MGIVKICLIAIIIVSSIQVFSTDYDDEKTSLLQIYLTDKVNKCSQTGEFPEVGELFEKVTALINEGANLHACNNAGTGTCALHFAGEAGSISLCQYLFERNAQLDVTDVCGRTPLHFACRQGHHEVVDFLLKAGANKETVNRDGYTPLIMALLHKIIKVVHTLLDNGANTEAQDQFGASALKIAFNCGDDEAILALLFHGADPLKKNFLLLEEAQRVARWHLQPVSGPSFFDRIYAFPKIKYLRIFAHWRLWWTLPKEIKLYIIRWVLAPWTFSRDIYQKNNNKIRLTL